MIRLYYRIRPEVEYFSANTSYFVFNESNFYCYLLLNTGEVKTASYGFGIVKDIYL